MLTHANTAPTSPARTVIVGAGGFVGSAIARNLEARGANVIRLGREQIDLMDAAAAEDLAGMLTQEDSVVLVSAVAPVKDAAMLRQNIVMIAPPV